MLGEAIEAMVEAGGSTELTQVDCVSGLSVVLSACLSVELSVCLSVCACVCVC